MPERVPQSAALRVPFQAYLTSDHVSPATGKTIAVTLSKNGGAYANPSGGATNATEIGSGSYYVDLSTTDAGTLGPLFVLGTCSGVDSVNAVYNVVKATNAGLSALPDTPATTNASLLTSGTGTDQVSVSSGKLLLQATQTGVTIPVVTTVSNQLTAAQVATGVWQDATGSDFTVGSSIGLSLYTGRAPGNSLGGLLCNNAAVSVSALAVNGSTTLNTLVVSSTTTLTGAVTASNAGNAITVTNLTNAPSAGDFTSAMKTSLNAATPASIQSVTNIVSSGAITTSAGAVSTVTTTATATAVGTVNGLASGVITAGSIAAAALNGKGDWLLASSYSAPLTAAGTRAAVGLASANLDTQLGLLAAKTDLPTNFAALSLTPGGKVSGVVLTDTLTTYTGNTVQTGDSYVRLGAAGAGLTAVRLGSAGLDAVTVESGLNARQSLSLLSAALGGILSGATGGNSTISIAGAGVGTVRILATCDVFGNRSVMTLTPPA